MQDLSDHQWREWSSQKWLLAATMIPFVIFSSFLRSAAMRFQWRSSVQIWFYAFVGLVSCWILHGSGTVWILVFVSGNYVCTRLVEPLPESLAVLIVWVYNAATLALTHMAYFSSIGFFVPALAFLDGFHGMVPWFVYYKMSMLRQVSFSIDYQIAFRHKEAKTSLDFTSQAKQTRRERQETADLSSFGFVPLFAYTTYLPLYLAGPIATFSSFARSCELRQKTVPLSEIAWMLVKVAIYWVGLDIFLHYIYVYSWNVGRDWTQYTPGVLSLICYWTLNFMYIKLMVVWRTFRALALLDGIYTVRFFATSAQVPNLTHFQCCSPKI